MIKFLDLKEITRQHSAEINRAIEETVNSGWYLQGERNKAFEKEYADYIGTDYAIGCGNGLDALTLIFRAYIEMGVMEPGDEVIVPANTYIASILAITENGLKPLLVEPDPETLQIDPEKIEEKITPRTKAIMIVHLYGRLAYSPKIKDLCEKYGLKLVEDNAQAHGCRYEGKLTGSLGDAAGHSFYPGKNLGALGDAGAVTTSDSKLAQMVKSLGNYGSSKKYIFDHIGRNSRLDEIQAAVLSAKLPFLDQDNNRRKEIAQIYYNLINHPAVETPATKDFGSNVFHIFPIFTDRRDDLQQYLKEIGVETLIHYPVPPHKQKCYPDWNYLSLPITEAIHNRELSLPISPVMTDQEAEQVARLINNWSPN